MAGRQAGSQASRQASPGLLQRHSRVWLLPAGQPGIRPVDQAQVQVAAAQVGNRLLHRLPAGANSSSNRTEKPRNQPSSAGMPHIQPSNSSGCARGWLSSWRGRLAAQPCRSAAESTGVLQPHDPSQAPLIQQAEPHLTASGRWASFHTLLTMNSSLRLPCRPRGEQGRQAGQAHKRTVTWQSGIIGGPAAGTTRAGGWEEEQGQAGATRACTALSPGQ